MAINLSQGILPGLQTADQLRNSQVARDSQIQADTIKLHEFERGKAQEEAEAAAFQELGSIMKGDGRSSGESSMLGDTDDWGEAFTKLGSRLTKAGFGKRGQELIEAGIDYAKKRADIDKSELDQEQTRLENMEKAGSWVAQNIGANESEYALFLDQLRDPNNPIADIIGRDNVEVLQNTPWSPELANYFRSKAVSIKDQATLALTERGHQRLEQSAADTERHRAALLRLNRDKLEETRRERERKEKTTGPNVGAAATSAEIATAKSVIQNTVAELKDYKGDADVDTAVNHMAENIAGRAKVIVADNKGTTYAEAVEQAVMEAEAAGDFTILKEVVPGLIWDSTRDVPTYKRRGTSAANPIKLPEGDKASIASKLVKGRYYETPMGVLKWNGSSFDQ